MKTNFAKPALSLLLALCMIFALAPSMAVATEDLSGKYADNITWTLTSDGTLTLTGTGELTSSWDWTKYSDQIKTIVINEGITSIGASTFNKCENATKVSLPSTLKTIGKNAFYRCGFEEVTIPQSVTEIGELAFATCYGMTRVYLPASVTKVGRGAFDYTILQEVYYGGTEAQWNKVSLYSYDKWHKRANMHYSVTALPPAPAKPDVSQATDWHFLMAIFKSTDGTVTANGKNYTVKNSLTDAEVERLYKVIDLFKSTMADTGLIVPHIDTVVIDAPITKLVSGPVGEYKKDNVYPSADGIFTLLKNSGVDLSKYDHVTAFGTLTRELQNNYTGVTTMVSPADGPSYAFVEGNNHGKSYTEAELKRLEDCNTASVIVHELLHTMERLSGDAFDLHAIRKTFGTEGGGMNDFLMNMLIVQNQITTGTNGSGVPAGTWTLTRTNALKAESLNIPEGVLKITDSLYRNLTNLKTVYIPASVTEIGHSAFSGTSVTDVYYGGTEAQWKKITFTRASDGKDYNSQLKNAKIHFNSDGFPS